MPRCLIQTVEDCFEESSIREIGLDRPLDEALVRGLGRMGSLDYYADFPRPFFRIETPDGFYMKGVVGKSTFRVFFGEPPDEEALRRAVERIEAALCG